MSDARAADYRRAGFGGTLGAGTRPALLLVDVVMAYFDAGSPLRADVDFVLGPAAQLAAAARRAGAPVVFTRVEYAPGGADGGLFYRKVAALACFEAGSPLGAFHPSLPPHPGDLIVTKHYPSAFFGTSLASTLHAGGIDTCVIGGLSTSGCVRATALDALCHGFAPLVVRDACGDRDAAVHEANLFDLQAKYADVIGLDEGRACFP
jgi:maleamate amidohydrolase